MDHCSSPRLWTPADTGELTAWVHQQETLGTDPDDILNTILSLYLSTLCRYDIDNERATAVFRDLAENYPGMKARWWEAEQGREVHAKDRDGDRAGSPAVIHRLFARNQAPRRAAALPPRGGPAQVFGLPWLFVLPGLALAAWGLLIALAWGLRILL